MSTSHLFMTAGFPKAPLKNGIGRYIGQCKRVTLKFCKSQGDSKGIRSFIETEIVDFAKNNPGIVVYLKVRRHRSPVIVAEYLNGTTEAVNCHNYNKDEVNKWLHWLTNRSGREVMRYYKMWHTDNPSIQGPWSPLTFRDPQMNLKTFPLKDDWGPKKLSPSATEELIELFKKQQLEEKENKSKP